MAHGRSASSPRSSRSPRWRGTRRWRRESSGRGLVFSEGFIANPQDGDLYWSFQTNGLRYYSAGAFGDIAFDDPILEQVLFLDGVMYPDAAAARAAVTANGQRVLHSNNLWTTSGYVASHTIYPWERVEMPVPWAGRFLCDLWDRDSTRGTTGFVALVLNDPGPSYLYIRRWTTSLNPIQAVNHLPIGALVGLRQGDHLLVLRTTSSFDEAESRYDVEVFHHTDGLSFVGLSRGTEFLITAPSSFIDIRYDSTRRQIRTTLLDASVQTFELTNLTPYVVADDSLIEPRPGTWVLEEDVEKLYFLLATPPAGDVYSSEIESDYSSGDYITVPYAQGPGDMTKWFRGDGQLADIPPPGISQSSADARYLRLTGGTVSGAVEVDSLSVGGTLATTQANLGLEPFARIGTGDQVPTSRLAQIAAQAYVGNTALWPAAKLGSGGSMGNVLFWGSAGASWGSIPASGISQADADARYLRLTGGTVTGAVEVDSLSVGGTLATTQTNLGLEAFARAGTSDQIPTSRLAQIAAQAYVGNTALWPAAKLGSGGSMGNVLFWGSAGASWGSITTSGISQADADARYLRLTGGTVTGAVEVDSLSIGGTLATTQTNLGLEAFARAGSSDQVPTSRLSQIAAQAYVGNTALWPAAKLGSGGSMGTVLFWGSAGASWGSLPSGSNYPGDDHVRDLVGGVVSATAPLAWSYDQTTRVGSLTSTARTEAQVNTQIGAAVEDFAKVGNTSTVPTAKVPDLDAGKITTGAFDAARIPGLAASKITTGVFDETRIPDLKASKVTSGTFAVARIPDLGAGKITTGVFDVARIPGLPAGRITSDVFDVARIPDLGAGKITSGTFAPVRIPNLDAGKITTGVFAADRIPGLPAGRITSDVFDVARIPDLGAGKITSGTFAAGRIPDLDAGKITTGVFAADRIPGLPAGRITSDVFDVARIPDLGAGKITSGVFGVAQIPDLGAGKITSGAFAAARIPSLDAGKITTGTFAAARIPSLSATKVTTGVFDPDRIPGLPAGRITSDVFDGARIPDLGAGKITSGTFAADRIPDLAAGKITTGTFAADRIPNLDASKITTGLFGAARIPGLAASKITTGTFADARIPGLAASKITSGTFAGARIPNLDASKTTSGTFADARIPALAASKITSGTFGTARLGLGTAQSGYALVSDGSAQARWSALPSGVTTFVALSDTPMAIEADRMLVGDSGGNNLVFADVPSAGTDTNDYLSALAFSLSGQQLTLTGTFTGSSSLSAITAQVTLPSPPAGITAADLEQWWADFDVSLGTSSAGLTLNAESDDGTNQSAVATPTQLANLIARIGGTTGQFLRRASGSTVAWATPPDNYVNALTLAVSGQELTVTLGRTGTLGDLAQTATLPAPTPGTTDYNALLNRPIIHVSNVAAIPAPGVTNVGHRYQTNDGHQYLIERHLIGHVDRVVNYTAVGTVAQGSAGLRGAVYTLYDLPPASLEVEGAYFLTQYNALRGGYPWYVRNVDGDWVPTLAYPGTGTFVGGYLDEARANPHVTAAGNVIAYGDGTVQAMQLYTVDADFVAGTGGTTVYEVVPTDRDAGVGGNVDALRNSLELWAFKLDTSLVDAAKLGAGTHDDQVWLRGDQTWASIPETDFVSAGAHGMLRAAEASDFNATPPFSRKLGWDGFQLYRVERGLTGGHTADADYTTVASDTNFTVSGTTYQYKGSHQHDYNVAASVNDFYFKWSTGYWRIFRARGNRIRDYWENFDVRTIIPTYLGDWDTEAEALGHVTAVGDYVVYIHNNAYTLRRVTAYTAPDPGDYTYSWAEYHAFAGDALTTDDVRAIIEQNAHTFVAGQTIDRHEYDGEHPALNIIVGAAGDRKALQFHNEDHATAWGSFEFALGSFDKPGFAFGPGDGARDVALYRDAANIWRTPDGFHAGAFNVDAAGAVMTRSNFGVMGRATDNTIEGTGEDGDPLKVSVQHVIEHSSERIRYVTSASFYSTRGSTVMQIFETGPLTYRVTHVSWDLDAPATGIRAQCRLYVLNDNNTVARKLGDTPSRGFSERGSGHYLYFADGGVLVPPNSRVGVAFSRTDESADSACFLKAGGQQANSPERSYNNAQEDWRYIGWGEYEHTDPGVGDGTVRHDTDGDADVYGNANIHYSLVIDHGQIVGDGTVDETHINAENADEGDVLTANGANPRRGVWSPPPKDVVLASDFEVDFAARVEQDLSRDFDDFNWIAVIAGESDADYGTYLRVPRSSVTEFVSGVEMLGWVMDNDADTVRLYEVDPSDGSLTPRGPSQSLSNRQWQGAGLAWVGTDLIGWVLDNDNDTVRLYDVDPADGVFTARSSSRSLGGGDWRGAGLAWTGSALLGWVITDGTDTARLYEVDLADGSISARGSARSIGSGSWRGAAVAWTGSELLGWVMDNQTDRVRLYEVDTSDGSLTARGSARSLGSGSWLGAGLAWTGFELLGWAVDNAVNTVQLYTVDTSDGTLTARGSARALGDGVYTGLDLVYRDTSSGGASGAGLRLDREDDDTIGITALERALHVHQVIGIP